MLIQFLVIVACQLLGNWLVEITGVSVPGTVVGMLLLFTLLAVRGGAPQPMVDVVAPLHRHMSLLFIPAGSGVLLYVSRVVDEWLPITVSLVVSTVVAFLVTAWVLERMMPKDGDGDGSDHGDTPA